MNSILLLKDKMLIEFKYLQITYHRWIITSWPDN